MARHLLFVGAVALMGCAGGLGLLFWRTNYAEVDALRQFVYHEEGFIRLKLPLTPARFDLLRAILLGAGLVGLALAAGLQQKLQPLKALRSELQHGAQRLATWWRRLPFGSRMMALALVGILMVVRLSYAVRVPLSTDEIASYDFFVRTGPLVTTCFYPIPNNHILYNLLANPLASLGLPDRWVMRLPTLLLGTLGTAGGLVLLARLVGLRIAILVTGLAGLAPLGIYYAAAGRGYFLQFCLLQAGFFATAELLRPTSAYQRLAWLAFVSSSVFGLYMVPTYAYPLLGLSVSLAAGFVLQRQPTKLRCLLLAGLIIITVTGVLYTPVGAVSGWDRLLANRYVLAKTPAQFWPLFRAVLYETAESLFGPPLRYSGPAWLATGMLGGGITCYAMAPGPRRRVALLAWVLVALPLPLMAIQRVYLTVRVLLYLNYFGYLLAALWLAQLPKWGAWGQSLRSGARWPFVLLTVAVVGSWRLWHNEGQIQASRHETQQIAQAYRWVRAHQPNTTRPTRIWLNSPMHELFFAHYMQQPSQRALTLTSSRAVIPNRPYDFLVLSRQFDVAHPAQRAYRLVYHDDLVSIYSPRLREISAANARFPLTSAK